MFKDPEDQKDSDNPWDDLEIENKTKSNKEKKDTSKIIYKKDSEKVNPSKKEDFLEDFLSVFLKKNNKKGGGKPPVNSSLTLFLILGSFALLWLFSGFYRVQEGEVAVVMRFGEMVRTTGAGWNYHFPSPIENVIIKEISAVNKIDSNKDSGEQSLILTGDENMVSTNYTVFWKIKDIAEFLFTARNPEATIRVASESALREVFGQTTARLALTEGREDISSKTQELLQKIMDQYKMGVQIINVQLQRVEPPAQVIETFNDMQASLVDADRLRNEAEAYRNDILPRARGEASKIIADAEAYKGQVVSIAEGETKRFSDIEKVAMTNKEVSTTKIYLEKVEKILKNAKKIIVDEKAGQGIVPYYNLKPPYESNVER
jgi:modulator of FtsH protease HflK